MGFIQNQRCFLFTLLKTYKQFIIWLFQVFLPVHSPPSISLGTAGVVPKPVLTRTGAPSEQSISTEQLWHSQSQILIHITQNLEMHTIYLFIFK